MRSEIILALSVNLSHIRPHRLLAEWREGEKGLVASRSSLQDLYPPGTHRSNQLLRVYCTFILKGRKVTFWDFSRASNDLLSLSSSSLKWFPLLAFSHPSCLPDPGDLKTLSPQVTEDTMDFSAHIFFFPERKSLCLLKAAPNHTKVWGLWEGKSPRSSSRLHHPTAWLRAAR